jgi:GTP-binding protein
LVDCLLKQSGVFVEGANIVRAMDSNVLEKERGITILSKCTSIEYNNFRINIVDTPGHADFGGEVERALSLVDGVLLVVDATEGPMPQTRFVLGKALSKKFKPIVVFNKVDRESSRCDEVDSELFDLFSNLGAEDDQLEYPLVYASAKEGWATIKNPGRSKPENKDMTCLLDLITSYVPPPVIGTPSPFAMLVNNIEKNNFLGKCLMGKVQGGVVKINDRIKALDTNNNIIEEGRVTKIFKRHGLDTVLI